MDTRHELALHLPAEAIVGNPIDLTYRSMPADYRMALETVLADPAVDSVLAIYTPPLVSVRHDVAGTIAAVAKDSGKPVLAVTLGHGRRASRSRAAPCRPSPSPSRR